MSQENKMPNSTVFNNIICKYKHTDKCQISITIVDKIYQVRSDIVIATTLGSLTLEFYNLRQYVEQIIIMW